MKQGIVILLAFILLLSNTVSVCAASEDKKFPSVCLNSVFPVVHHICCNPMAGLPVLGTVMPLTAKDLM